jgi:hypothetical protein
MELKEVDGPTNFVKYIFQGVTISKAGELEVAQASRPFNHVVLRQR